MTKRTRISIETDSLLIVRGRTAPRAWCPACATEVESIDMEQTGVISNLDRPALEEWLNSDQLHRLQSTDGSVVVCLTSLLARAQTIKPT